MPDVIEGTTRIQGVPEDGDWRFTTTPSGDRLLIDSSGRHPPMIVIGDRAEVLTSGVNAPPYRTKHHLTGG